MLKKKLEYLNKQNCTLIGTTLKLHSFKGQIIVKTDFGFAEIIEEPVFIEFDNYLVPFFIDNKSVKYLNDDTAIIRFTDIDNEIEAQKLLNKKIYFPTELISEEEDSNNIKTDLVGFFVNDKTLGKIGIIEDIIEIPGNPLLQINYLSKEVLIPFNGVKIIERNLTAKSLLVILPEGILDI